MTQALIWELAKIALEKGPDIAREIREWIAKGSDVKADAMRFERALAILRKNPEDYFGERRPDIDDTPDPTEIVHATKDAAIAAAQRDGYPLVLEMPDGTFRVWPMIGPLPGKKVWSE